jgi:uncharacterized membrane protein
MKHKSDNGMSAWMCGLACGAGAMYFLDPGRGRRRRALIRDKAYKLFNRSGDAVDATARNLRDEASGFAANLRSRFRREQDVPDDVLTARVRSEMGRATSHPHAIEVVSSSGDVTLRGPVLREEVNQLLCAVRGVRGVNHVNNELQAHDEPGNVPGLQGGTRRPGRRSAFMRNNWSPAVRCAVGTGGGILAIAGAARGGIGGIFAAIGGSGLVARAISNLDARRLTGAGAGRRAVDLHKTLHINAPVEEVFAFWDNFENFPRFMSHLKEVRRTGEGRSHWIATVPGGITFEWDATTTRHEPNQQIEWRSEPGAWVESAGMVRFEAEPNGRTRIDIQMSYNPPGGAIGHAFASLFGIDPKSAMDEDLIRLKSLMEHNKATAHGHKVYRDELEPARRPA